MSNEKTCPLCGRKPAPLDVQGEPLYCEKCSMVIDILTLRITTAPKPRPALLFRTAQELAEAERAMGDQRIKGALMLAFSAISSGEPS